MKVWGGAINVPYYLAKTTLPETWPIEKNVIPKGTACRPSINVQIVSGSTNINTHVTVQGTPPRQPENVKNHAGWWFQPV